MGIFDTLKRATDPRAKIVSNDLTRLNEARAGLGDKAIAYVLDGRDETVLATIANTRSANVLEIAKTYLDRKSPSWPRRQWLAQQEPFDPEFTRRYAEVLSAACDPLPDSVVGTDKVPRLIRVLLSEVVFGVRAKQNIWPPKPVSVAKTGFTLDAAIAMTPTLGGTLVDLVDALYHERGEYGMISPQLYRMAADLKPLLKQHPDDVVVAGKRIHAKARVVLIDDLQEFQLVNDPVYLHFVLGSAGDSAKGVREVSRSVLSGLPQATLEPLAVAQLAGGNANMRAAMVSLLGNMGTDTALAALVARKEVEKTARVVSAIDTVLAVSQQSVAERSAGDDATGYQTIAGNRIEIPPLVPLEDGEPVKFGASDKAELLEIIAAENVRLKQRNEDYAKMGYRRLVKMLGKKVADEAIGLFNTLKAGEKTEQTLFQFLGWGAGATWTRKALGRLPQKKVFQIAAANTSISQSAVSAYAHTAFIEPLKHFIVSPQGDMRHLENIDIDTGVKSTFGYGGSRKERAMEKGDFLRSVMQEERSYMESYLDNVHPDGLWPYIAENLEVIDEAFGLRPPSIARLSPVAAVHVLNRLPEPPARYLGPLLEAAAGEKKAGRAEARAMLREAADIGKHIVGLLDDSRQAIRAGAAEWITEREDTGAIPALLKRLKKEKSEVAKAAILTALDALGEDLSGFVGPKALLAEAEAGLKKAKFTALEWLKLDHLPVVHYRSGRKVPGEVLRWWIFLAAKLKQPGGNALFDIYLDQLKPEDATSFSGWVLDSWINHDTARPNETDAIAHAEQHADRTYRSTVAYLETFTREDAFESLKLAYMAQYPNSGAATKGLLALARHAPSAIAADRVRAYLKNHGSRTSQSSALLEVLAGMGDPVALQVVIAAATRLKQKGVQTFAGTLIQRVAEAKNWSLDELADRTIPTAGLDDTGTLELPCSEEGKVYTAYLDDSLSLKIRNPDGKTVKSLPGGQDEATKAARKQLSASRRELKQVIAMQTARFYEALCAGRAWPIEDWRRDLYDHPVMRKLVERTVWFGLSGDGDGDGDVQGAFRPTAEGDFTDAADDSVETGGFAAVRLAYGAEMPEADAAAWAGHLDDYEIKPLFTQFGRSLLTVNASDKDTTAIVDRKGWVTDAFTIRGAASKLGYERGEAMDAGFFNEYIKSFQSAGILAVIEFSGNCLPEENVPAALISLSFEKHSTGRRTGAAVKLRDVPPVLLSECWNDYHVMAAKGAHDENWEKKMPW